MQPDLISTKAAADKIGIHYLKLLNRGELLNLQPKVIHRSFYWTNEQLKQIAFYQPIKKPRKDATNKYAVAKIKIIELFLTQNNNSCRKIAEQTGQNFTFVSDTINEFIKTKHIIVESKMNL